nr:unnamed protein product [Callosobruchus analis]
MEKRRKLHLACLLHKVLLQKSPVYLYNKLRFASEVHNVKTRNTHLLLINHHKTSLYERSFSYNAASIYNVIPINIKSHTSHAIRKEKSLHTLHLLSSKTRNVQAWSGGSKFGASSDSRLHSCAYIDEYLGSSSAFSNIRIITPFKITVDCRSMRSKSSLSFLNFSGVSLLRIPRTCMNIMEKV